MPADRPPNHVEQLLRERLSANSRPDLPEPQWSEAQIAWMEAVFPPRCLGTSETVESHLRYAGVVAFVADRRAAFNNQKRPEVPPPEGDEDDGLGSFDVEHV